MTIHSRRTRRSAEDRKEELVAATLEVIGAACSLDVKVSDIASKAGVSSALAHHYFGGKDDLFFAAMRKLLRQLMNDLVQRQRQASTPRARISAVIEASFAPEQFDPVTVAAWIAFYTKSQSNKRFHSLLDLYFRRLKTNLLHELRALKPGGDHAQAAEAIGAMIDGLYLRQGLRSGPANSEECIQIAENLVDNLLLAPAKSA